MIRLPNTKILITLLALLSFTIFAKSVPSLYSARSQGQDEVRKLIGWQNLLFQCEYDSWNAALGFETQYSQSFDSKKICNCLLGTDAICANDCCGISISGSCVANRGATDWLADYFGLPTDFQGTVTFRPTVKTFVADMQLYVGMDEWFPGLYFEIFLPVASTHWALNFKETVIDKGSNNHAPGYFDPLGVLRSGLLDNATQFFSGNDFPELDTEDTVVFQPLICSKWNAPNCGSKSLTQTSVADLETIIGYVVSCQDDYTVNVYVRSAAPTSNKPSGEFFFEPLAGNGHHWTLGAGALLRYDWEFGETGEHLVTLLLDDYAVHLFKTDQERCFDLCSAGANSRYMLAEKILANSDSLEGISGGITTRSHWQFANVFAPVANLTMSSVNVTVPVQGEVTLMAIYEHDNGCSINVGYNFWASACEKIELRCTRSNINIQDWTLKGDSYVYGFGCTGTVPVALATSESAATIHEGTNFPGISCSSDAAFGAAQANPRIDNAEFAIADTSCGITPLFARTAGPNNNQTRTSIQPVRLSNDDINLTGMRGLSHTVFAHFNYTWFANHYLPFLGFGASGQWGHNGSCQKKINNSCCNRDCLTCSLSTWSVWIKGGCTFH